MTNTIVLIYFHPDILILIIHKILYIKYYIIFFIPDSKCNSIIHESLNYIVNYIYRRDQYFQDVNIYLELNLNVN